MLREQMERAWDDSLDYHRAHTRHAEERRAVVEARKVHLAEGKKGRPPSTLSRRHEVRSRTHGATFDSLLSIGAMRLSRPPQVATAIFEGLCELWQQFPYDETLYIRRVEDPLEAQGCIHVGSQDEPVDVLYGSPRMLFRMLSHCVYLLIHLGNTPVEVEAFISELLDYEEERRHDE